MKQQTWTDLLEKLIAGTDSRRIKWKSTDSRGVVVAAFTKSSIRIVGIDPPGGEYGAISVGLTQPPVLLELRDADGEVTGSLEAAPTGLLAAHVANVKLSFEALGQHDDDYESHSDATAHQQQLIDQLVDSIRSTRTIAETLARGIIDEI